MPLGASDIKSYKSLNPDSDGGAIDTSREITTGVDNNLFPDISGAEQLSGGTRYRKFFRKNTSGVFSWLGVKSWIQQQPANATVSVGIGLDHADDDDGVQGNMTAFSATAKVALISDGADTRTCTVVGEDGSGARQTEAIVLTGAVEVVGSLDFAKVYAVYVASESSTRTVTVRQGAGGTARGTIGTDKKICWLWRSGADIDAEAEGYRHGDIGTGGNFGLWLRKVWAAGAAAGSAFSTTLSSAGTSS